MIFTKDLATELYSYMDFPARLFLDDRSLYAR